MRCYALLCAPAAGKRIGGQWLNVTEVFKWRKADPWYLAKHIDSL